ncbi:MAG: pyroglutamyl-peptidase I [Planctomycetota bacterium]
MTRILLTAFEPYDRWRENSSWLALVDLTSWYEGPLEFVTRRYPVDLAKLRQSLERDLSEGVEFAIHLGQAPGSPLIKMETVGLNLRADGEPLRNDAPVAYRTALDLQRCVERLAEAGIPSQVSHHAGTYLCNAALFLSHHFCAMTGQRTESVFVHLPLTPAQAAKEETPIASMSTPMQSAAIAMIAQQLVDSAT